MYVTGTDVSVCRNTKYDLFVAALGYESRSIYCSQHLIIDARFKIADAFCERHELSYEENMKWFEENDFTIREIPEDKSVYDIKNHYINTIIDELVCNEPKYDRQLMICIDISSMSRYKIALWIEFVLVVFAGIKLKVDFLYSLAPINGSPGEFCPIKFSGPVTSFFAGWSPNIDLPLSVVIGLGYDPIKALGICEYLETTNVYAMAPAFRDENQSDLVMTVNEEFFRWMQRMGTTGGVYNYYVEQPFKSFLDLQSLAYPFHRAVIIPFGPKIFALQSFLLSIIYAKKISVWRVSGGQEEEPVQRVASGDVVGLTLVVKD